MKNLLTCVRSPEIVGIVFGLFMLFGWPLRYAMLEEPVLALWEITLLASLAGAVLTICASLAGERPERSVRRGALAAVYGAVFAGVCLSLLSRTVPGFDAAFRGRPPPTPIPIRPGGPSNVSV